MDPSVISQWLMLIAEIVAMLRSIGVFPPPPHPAASATPSLLDHNETALWLLAAQIATASMTKK